MWWSYEEHAAEDCGGQKMLIGTGQVSWYPCSALLRQEPLLPWTASVA